MSAQAIAVTANFKSRALKAISSVFLFVAIYIVLVVLAMGLTVLCGYLGILVISLKANFLTLMLGLGLISMGILVLIFLVKFIFKKHTVDRSHLIEITQQDEPALFAFIQGIVDEVKTDFPKKVYLASDVNAAVFYDSNFWSMFLPVRKNLQIGIGLVNSISVLEFKAILAHEFGHFSQRSMKIGSYVYNVNKVIYNLLYENDSYTELAINWANMSGYLAPFVAVAVKTVGGIQWLLRKNYELINKHHLGLSREMEFHADEIAAHVAGSAPLISSLPRIEFADYAFNRTLAYYNERIDKGITTKNLLPQHKFVMCFLAEKNKVPLANGIPQISQSHLSRYNKSKLVIKDQWASHPSTEDRIAALERIDIRRDEDNHVPASSVFQDIELLQEEATAKIFSAVAYSANVMLETNEQFSQAFREDFFANSFHELFNGYYDNKSTGTIALEEAALGNRESVDAFEALFDEEKVALVYTSIALEK